MTRADITDLLSDDETVIFLEGADFDAAILGLAERFGAPRVVLYDYDRVLKILERQGMSAEEAVEWYEFNMIGAYLGETTPIYLHRPSRPHRTPTRTARP